MSKKYKNIVYEFDLVMPDGKVALYDKNFKIIMVIDAIKEGIIKNYREKELFENTNEGSK